MITSVISINREVKGEHLEPIRTLIQRKLKNEGIQFYDIGQFFSRDINKKTKERRTFMIVNGTRIPWSLGNNIRIDMKKLLNENGYGKVNVGARFEKPSKTELRQKKEKPEEKHKVKHEDAPKSTRAITVTEDTPIGNDDLDLDDETSKVPDSDNDDDEITEEKI